jgi:hypothetical protein
MALPEKIPPPITPKPEKPPAPPPPEKKPDFLGGREYVRTKELTKSIFGEKCFENLKIPKETRSQLKQIFEKELGEVIGTSKKEIIQQAIDHLRGTSYPSSETARRLGEKIKEILGGSPYKAKALAEYLKKEFWK